MRLGGLFSGIGGFELAWTRLGHEVAWMCEVDPAARRVLEARFPGVPIYEDVRDLDPAEVEPVDVLTGGSPCQGFSVAGHRTGLQHEESQLFADYVRVLEGLADRGLRWAVWENVPGVLSIKNDDGERTFPHVIAALLGAGVPVRLDPTRRWNVGLGLRRGRATSWRVLDSRHFGVAQRRRRIFACVALDDPDGRRAVRALLAESTGLPGHSAASVTAREAPPAGPRGRAHGEGGGRAGGDGRGVGVDEVAHTLTTRLAGGATEDGTGRGAPIVTDLPAVAHTLTGTGFDASEDGTGRGTPLVTDLPDDELAAARPSHTGPLTTGMASARGSETSDSHHVIVDVPRAFRKSRRAQSANDPESWVEDGAANTLNPFDASEGHTTHAVVAQTFVLEPETGQGADLRGRATETSPALTQTNAPDRVIHVVEPIPIQDAERGDKRQNGAGIGRPGDPSYTLDTASTHAVAVQEPYGFSGGNATQSRSMGEEQGVSPPIRAGAGGNQVPKVGPVAAADAEQEHGLAAAVEAGLSYDGFNQRLELGTHRSLRVGQDSSDFVVDPAAAASARPRWGVRRLTPVECERLQAFPDGWTEPAGSDSARYKALGNAVTVNTVEWILRRILVVEATPES